MNFIRRAKPTTSNMEEEKPRQADLSAVVNLSIKEMYDMEGMLNYDMFAPPYTINTFTLWRDLKFN
jgi:hypothetical protein